MKKLPRKGKKKPETTETSLRRRLWTCSRINDIRCIREKNRGVPHGLAWEAKQGESDNN